MSDPFVLTHAMVGDAGAPQLGLLLHGVLGAGNNLRSLALRLSKERPEYRFALVDLRHHGGSVGAPRPNTLRACAHDLHALVQKLDTAPSVVVGHSFGGKAALLYASLHPEQLRQVWLLDSNPGTQSVDTGSEVPRVLATARSLPGPFATRADVVSALTERGLSSGTAQWLATSLRRTDAGFTWLFDFDAISELLDDYFQVDLWSVLESAGPPPEFHVILAERSDRWSASERERLERIGQAGRVHVDVIPNAGHWLHVDNPDYLVTLIARSLPR